AQRIADGAAELRPAGSERAHHSAPEALVVAEPGGRLRGAAPEDPGFAGPDRVRERNLVLREREPFSLEAELPKRRTRQRHRMIRRAHVVEESREGRLGRAQTAARRLARLDDDNAPA